MQDRINYFIFLPALFLSFLIGITFLPQIFAGGFPPNFVMIMIFAAAFLASSSDFLYVVFLFGFLLDILAGTVFGVYIASLVFSAILICRMKTKFLKEENFLQIAAIASAGALAYHIITLSFLAVAANGTGAFYGSYIWERAAFDAAYAALLTYPAIRLISKKKQ